MNKIPSRFRGKIGQNRLLEVLKSLKIVRQEDGLAKDLLAITNPMTFDPGRGTGTIITEGELSTDIYFLLSGEASVRIKRREVAIRRAGDHVGEMALIDPIHPRSASVIATKRTEVGRVSQKEFLKLAVDHPDLWKRLCIELGSRLRQRGNSIPKPNKVPVVFIGSATRQVRVMNALAKRIEGPHVKVRRWSKGVFGLSGTTIETLESVFGNADFAVIILAADDKIVKNKKLVETHRDNCVFELGMGMGGLGRNRTFFLKENKVQHLLSDLAGVTYHPFDLAPPARFEMHIKDAAREIKARIASSGTK